MVWSSLLSFLKARGKSVRPVPRVQVRRKSTTLWLEMLEQRNVPTVNPCSLQALTVGHVDGFEVNFANGQWQMGTWERDTDTHYDVNTQGDSPVLFVGLPGSRTTQPAGDQWSFLGAGAGNTVWILPQFQDPTLLYLGTNDEGTDPNDLLSYMATDPRLPQDVAVPWIQVSVVGFQALGNTHGDLSLFSTDSFGNATVWVDTADTPPTNPSELWLIAGGHVHYNWGFTQRGYYALTVQASAFLPDGTPTSSQFATYYLSAEQPGCLDFSMSNYTVDEAAGTATITVNRNFGSDGPVTVDFATSDGTAHAGVDYTATAGTLSWAAGDFSPKTFTIPILNDGFVENNETINLTLSNPTGGALVGMQGPAPFVQSTAVLTIHEANDVASVQDVQVNPGSGQSVTSLTVTFTDIVDSGYGQAGIGSGAFELQRQDGGPPITVSFTTTQVNHQTVATLTFTGDDVVGGALPDGNYTLIVHGTLVQDFLGNNLNGDGSDFTFAFSSPLP
jgi:surface-anchored protein